jgi:DNA-binding NarL/FixJ family response regulator
MYEYSVPTASISDDDVALLNLCLDELRDHEISARMFISVRTVHRRLDRLMNLTGTRTRFGLGARATKLGWINPSAAPPMTSEPRQLAG